MANTPNIRYGADRLVVTGRVGTLFLFITQIGQPDEMYRAAKQEQEQGKYRVGDNNPPYQFVQQEVFLCPCHTVTLQHFEQFAIR